MDRAKEVCKELINQRGYSIGKSTDQGLVTQKENGKNVLVFFCDHPKLNIEIIKNYICILKEFNIDHSIIIYNNSLTSSAKRVVDNVQDIKIELFLVDELQYNITTHRYFIPHVKVNETEKKEIYKKIGNKLPILLASDPVSRFYNFEPEDLIKVTRTNGFVSYRKVS